MSRGRRLNFLEQSDKSLQVPLCHLCSNSWAWIIHVVKVLDRHNDCVNSSKLKVLGTVLLAITPVGIQQPMSKTACEKLCSQT